MDPKDHPKYDPPPYSAGEQTVTPIPTSTAQLPVSHVQPRFTIVSDHITERQQGMARGPNVTPQTIQQPSIPAPIPFSYPWEHQSGRRFPTHFNMYYRPRFGGRRDYFLALPHSEPLNAVTFHSIRLPSIALHPGFDKSRAIATFNHSNIIQSSRIHATWLVGGHTDVRIRHVSRTWSFAARVGQANSGGIAERFEWRRTTGHSVHYHLGANKGWKLLRLDRAAQTHNEGAERSRDGAEVVATFSFGRDDLRNYNSRVYEAFKLLSFAYVGVGATGELGEEWEVLAVMTALGIWHRDRD